MAEKRDFDREAITWDEPRRAKMAADIAGAIFDEVQICPDMTAMDFGCGTGLLSLCLQPFVLSIDCVDSSQGMLAVLEDKIKDRHLTNVRTLMADPDNGDRLIGRYDLITSSMAVHHVKDVPALLKQLYSITTPGGRLCIADLDPDGGMFHGDNHDGVFHDGFERKEMCKMFIDAGYTDIRNRKAAAVIKPVPDGGAREFSIFLVTGRKKLE